MTPNKLRLLSLITFTLLTSCGYLFLKDIKCREFKTDNLKLFPGRTSDTISFTSTSGIKKTFVIKDKFANHTTNYVSDTGCSCRDVIQILYTSGQDSIWYSHELNYLYDQKDKEYFGAMFILDGVRNGFNESFQDSTIINLELNGVNYDGIKKFINKDFKDNRWIKECYFADNIGLIKFEKANGEIWTQDNPKKIEVTKDISNYEEKPCN